LTERGDTGTPRKKKRGWDKWPLDRYVDTGNNDAMSKGILTITDVLRAAIERSGLTRYRIAKETGIPESNLRRFCRGEMSVRLDKADKLAAYLGLRLVPDPDATPPEPTPDNLARPMLAKRKTRAKAKRKANHS
jgi:ribosome-binding protein aMBF1 (putative translation factor)